MNNIIMKDITKKEPLIIKCIAIKNIFGDFIITKAVPNETNFDITDIIYSSYFDNNFNLSKYEKEKYNFKESNKISFDVFWNGSGFTTNNFKTIR